MLSGMLGAVMEQVRKVQEQVAQIEQELDRERIEASSGGGMVTAVVTGMGELLEVKIDPQVVDPNEVEMLQDLIVAAVREALARAEELHREKMKAAYATLSIPGLDNFLRGLLS